MPKSWREGDVKPIHKKGGEEKVENYRGITLMDIEYKIYTEILRQRLVKEFFNLVYIILFRKVYI